MPAREIILWEGVRGSKIVILSRKKRKRKDMFLFLFDLEAVLVLCLCTLFRSVLQFSFFLFFITPSLSCSQELTVEWALSSSLSLSSLFISLTFISILQLGQNSGYSNLVLFSTHISLWLLLLSLLLLFPDPVLCILILFYLVVWFVSHSQLILQQFLSAINIQSKTSWRIQEWQE